MKRLVLGLGIVSLLLGLVALVHPNFDYHRHEEIARIGPIRTTFDKPERANIPPVAAAVMLISGAVLIVLGARTKS